MLVINSKRFKLCIVLESLFLIANLELVFIDQIGWIDLKAIFYELEYTLAGFRASRKPFFGLK